MLCKLRCVYSVCVRTFALLTLTSVLLRRTTVTLALRSKNGWAQNGWADWCIRYGNTSSGHNSSVEMCKSARN